MIEAQQFQIKNFYGTVFLKEWMRSLSGIDFLQIRGKISVVKDTELVGFEVTGKGTENWAVRVVGEKEQWTILGCQIRAVVAHEQDAPVSSHNAYLVR